MLKLVGYLHVTGFLATGLKTVMNFACGIGLFERVVQSRLKLSLELYITLIKKWHPRLANISWLYLPHRRGGNRQLVQSAKAEQLTQETASSPIN